MAFDGAAVQPAAFDGRAVRSFLDFDAQRAQARRPSWRFGRTPSPAARRHHASRVCPVAHAAATNSAGNSSIMSGTSSPPVRRCHAAARAARPGRPRAHRPARDGVFLADVGTHAAQGGPAGRCAAGSCRPLPAAVPSPGTSWPRPGRKPPRRSPPARRRRSRRSRCPPLSRAKPGANSIGQPNAASMRSV